jgi:hypothetical protein
MEVCIVGESKEGQVADGALLLQLVRYVGVGSLWAVLWDGIRHSQRARTIQAGGRRNFHDI